MTRLSRLLQRAVRANAREAARDLYDNADDDDASVGTSRVGFERATIPRLMRQANTFLDTLKWHRDKLTVYRTLRLKEGTTSLNRVWAQPLGVYWASGMGWWPGAGSGRIVTIRGRVLFSQVNWDRTIFNVMYYDEGEIRILEHEIIELTGVLVWHGESCGQAHWVPLMITQTVGKRGDAW